MRTTAVFAAVLGSMAVAASAADNPPANVRIPFANYGGIFDWRADGDHALYIQGRNRQWYHAELMGPCTDLPFAEHIGFVIEPSGDLDRFSAIVVHHHQCMFTSLTPSGPPPKPAKAARGNTTAPAAPPAAPPP